MTLYLGYKFYCKYNIIQNKVVNELIANISDRPQTILDLGCGQGAIYQAIEWYVKEFIAVDNSAKMLKLHDHSKNISLILGDFNDTNLFDKIKNKKFDRIISASSLQWAQDLGFTFKKIEELKAPISLAIFTSKTFQTIHQIANIPPLIRSKKEVIKTSKKYFDAQYKTIEYKLNFKSARDMFLYIKKSGVSGGRNILNYKQAKDLMRDYPLKYLEFEVLFINN